MRTSTLAPFMHDLLAAAPADKSLFALGGQRNGKADGSSSSLSGPANEALISRLLANGRGMPPLAGRFGGQPASSPGTMQARAVRSAPQLPLMLTSLGMLTFLTGLLRELVAGDATEEIRSRFADIVQFHRMSAESSLNAVSLYQQLERENAEKAPGKEESASYAGSNSIKPDAREAKPTDMRGMTGGTDAMTHEQLRRFPVALPLLAQKIDSPDDHALSLSDWAQIAGRRSGAAQPPAVVRTPLTVDGLMLLLDEVLAAGGESSLKFEIEMARAQMQAQAARLKQSAAEYTKKLAEQEALTKKLGIIGKIIGVILAVLGVLLAIPTGGASLLLASAIAVLVIVEAATDVAIFGKVLEPLMESVLKPLMEKIGKLIEDALKKSGVSDEFAQTLGAVFGAILGVMVAAAAVVVLVVVGKSAAAKFMEKFGTKLAESLSKKMSLAMGAFRKAAPTGLKAAKPTSAIARWLESEHVAKLASHATTAVAMAQFLVATGSGASQIVVAQSGVSAAYNSAEMELLRKNRDLCQLMMDDLLRNFSSLNETIASNRTTSLEIQKDKFDTLRYMAQKMGQRHA